MFKSVWELLKKPQMITGIVTALAFQIIFSVVWITGYEGGNDRIRDFKIAIVNEDQMMGKQIVQKLKEGLPFQVKILDDRDTAKQQLMARDVHMMMVIPFNFTKDVQELSTQANLIYEINESNPALVKSVMDSAAISITGIVNHEAVVIGINKALEQLALPVSNVKGTAEGLANRVSSVVSYIHPVNGLNNQMIPLMMVLASFVGAMIMGMNMQQASITLMDRLSKWQIFKARTIINIGSALIISLLGSSLVIALGGQSAKGFLTLWMLQSLIVWVFLVFTQLFLIIFGMGGMLFNILLLSLQLVTSGAIIPRTLLGAGYQTIGNFLPATYAVEGLMNVVFGGIHIERDIWRLILVAFIAISISAGVIALRKSSKDKSLQESKGPSMV